MLSPEEFRGEYPEDELTEKLPGSPVGSLRDIQYLYGKLYTLATTGGGEYAPYLTPDAASDLEDSGDSLIVVRIDLSGDEPRLANDERGPVWVTRYRDNRVRKVAHCYYQNRGNGIDHSITHKSGQNKSPERLGEYAKHRFTRWPTEDAVQELIDSHDDGCIIEQLRQIGERDELTDEIKHETERQIGGDRTALLTVQIRTEESGEFRWPSEVDVLMEGMRVQRLSKLVTKNKATDSSGEATDLITGKQTRTVGTAQDPQNYFLGKQLEKFPGIDIEEAWRTHPISEDAAVTVMNAETFVEACTYRTFGAKVYYLPYVWGRISPSNAYDMYQLLYSAETEGDDLTPVERAYENREALFDDARLRFYVSAVMPHQTSRYDVFGETLNGRLLYPRALAHEHNRLVRDTAAFNSATEWTAPLPTHDNWDLLTGNDEQLRSVSTGWYFHQTFAERDDDDADADDPRIEALVAVLSGDAIPVETLLSEYVDRIVAEQTDEEIEGFPSFHVASQFAQLCALATDELDLLSTTDPEKDPITREPTYERHTMETETEMFATDGGYPPATKLESFIEDTPALAHEEEDDSSLNDQRRGAFLLGALVGEVGSYQGYSEDRSTTLIDQFPVKSITGSRIKKVTQETIGKTLTYTRSEDRTVTLFEHVVERLRETILNPDPDDWELDTDDLRFYYALGVTYGMNDHPEWDSEETDNSDETAEDS